MEFQIRLFRSEDIECIVGGEGCLGAGSYGTVKLGFHKLHGIVAVKCSEMSGGIRRMNQLERRIKNEVEVVQRAQHDNIVRVYGWTHWPGAIAIVMEYLAGGNLMEALDDPDVPLEPLLRLRMVYEISNGIAFIHNLSPGKRLVHGDIKAENILLTEDLHCKLSDFGGARWSVFTKRLTSTNRRQYSNQFTELYASPEILENPTAQMKPPHDTFSFSVTMYVLIRRELPILSDLQMNIYLEKVKRGHRPDIEVINVFIHELQDERRHNDVEVIMTMKKLMEKCWSQNPSDRPLMIDVKSELHNLLARQDSVEITQLAVDTAREMNIHKISRYRHQCLPLNKFLSPDFISIQNELPPMSSIDEKSSNIEGYIGSKISKDPYSLAAKSSKDRKCKGFLAINGENVRFYDVTTKRLHRLLETKFNHFCGSAINLNEEVFVVSGRYTNSVEKIKLNDLSSGWVEVASTIHRRYDSASAAFGGCIYTVGGRSPKTLISTTSGESFHPDCNRWNYIMDMSVKRYKHALVPLQGKLYALGGVDRTNGQTLNSAECYDVRSDEWTTIPSMQKKRSYFSSVALNNEIYAIGGLDDENKQIPSVERYNPESKKWDEIASLNSPRYWHGSCVINGKIYVAGSRHGTTIEVYDPSNDIWEVEGSFQDLKGAEMIVSV